MHSKFKASVISLIIISVLTVLKFIIYYISGSIAVISEAFHSVSDIGTTILVLLSIHWSLIKEKTPVPEVGTERPGFKGFVSKIWRVEPELKAAVIIGFLLLIVSCSLIWNAVFSQPRQITNPLIAGLVFIGFSCGSFFIYKFQSMVAEQENSAALKADSLHSKADTIVSLLTGDSLLLFRIGLNIDRVIGGLIGLFIFSFAVEMVVNGIISIARNKPTIATDYPFGLIVLSLFKKDTYSAIARRLNLRPAVGLFLRRVSTSVHFILRAALASAVIISAGAFISSMFFSVGADEQALVLRFGRAVNAGNPAGPGLHVKLPWPIDTVEKATTGRIYSVSVGNDSKGKKALIWAHDHGDTTDFLLGGKYLFMPYMTVHFKITNLYEFLYVSNDPGTLLRSITNKVLTEIFVGKNFYEIALTERTKWPPEAQERIQQYLNGLNAGITISSIDVNDVHPPVQVAGSFEKVVAARQVREKEINEAEKYRYKTLPAERAAAVVAVYEAENYSREKQDRARGESEAFHLQVSGYQTGKQVLRQQLILNTAEKALAGKDKIILDPRTGLTSDLLYLEQYIAGRKGGR